MRGGWRVAFLYFVLTLALAYPISRDPAGTVLSNSPDTRLFMWTLAWDSHAFIHQPLAIFDANIYYPERETLAYSENLIGNAFVAAPVLWVTGNMVLAMNVVALLACVLCGLGAWLLARRAGVGPAGAVIAGLVFAFSPPRFLRIDQLHLTTIEWVPFGLAYLHGYLDDGRPRDLRLFAACFTLQALTSGHGAVFLTVGALLLVAYRVALGEQVAAIRRARDFGVSGVLLLVPAALVVWPYRRVQLTMGLRRTLENWTVSWSSFLASPTYAQTFLLSLAPAWRINQTADAYLFPGVLTLVLAGAALAWPRPAATPERPTTRATAWARAAAVLEIAAVLSFLISAWVAAVRPIRWEVGDVALFVARRGWRGWIVCGAFVAGRVALQSRVPFTVRSRVAGWAVSLARWRTAHRRSTAGPYLLVTLIGLWLSLGPPVGLWPLVYWLPGMDFIRVPSRFMLLALVGLAVLAGVGFDRISERLAPRRASILAVIVGALLVGEFVAIPLDVEPYRVEIPAIDAWLATQPGPFAIAEVPLASPRDLGAWERRHTLYMLHSTAHWEKTVEGYSGLRPPLHEQLYTQLTTFPDAASLATLERIGVTYVVVHTDYYPPEEWEKVEQRLARLGTRLTLTHVEGAGRVYTLRRRDGAG